MSEDIPKIVGLPVSAPLDPLVREVMREYDEITPLLVARLSDVLAAARAVAAAVRSVNRLAAPYAPCPGHTNQPGARDDGRHDDCEACQANDRTDADLDTAERVLAGTETNLCNAIADADGAR